MNLKQIVTIFVLSACCSFASAQTDSLFYIDGSMGRLAAHLHLPQTGQGEKCHLAILCHGFTANMDMPPIKDVADSLNKVNIGTLRFDFNGHGRSEGNFSDMTVLNEIDDLLSVIAFARNLPQVADISLVGHSQGGVVVAMTAGRLGKGAIRALVLMAPAAVLRDDALRGNTMGATYDPWHAPEHVTLPTGQKLGRNYIQTAISLPIYETTSRYDGPALVVHGMEDRIVPYTYGERFSRVMQSCRLELIPGDNHMFTVNLPYAVSLVSRWFTNIVSLQSREIYQ